MLLFSVPKYTQKARMSDVSALGKNGIDWTGEGLDLYNKIHVLVKAARYLY